jgi:hypothetical protein
MVVDYSNLFQSVKKQIPEQDWSDETWTTNHDGTSVNVYRESWVTDGQNGVYYRSYGQGDDPEQEPIMLELVLGDQLEDRELFEETLNDRLQGDMKDLIGWSYPDDIEVFMRKELPSDPLTLLPRLLEEFKKLEIVSQRVDETLGEMSATPG